MDGAKKCLALSALKKKRLTEDFCLSSLVVVYVNEFTAAFLSKLS